MSMNLNRNRHADLVDRMANSLGIDLEEKILEGQLQIDTLGDAVLSCTGCSDPDGCERWLESREGVAHDAPAMCRNGELFKLLKQGKHV